MLNKLCSGLVNVSIGMFRLWSCDFFLIWLGYILKICHLFVWNLYLMKTLKREILTKPKILTPPGMGQKASRIRYKDSQSWKNWNIWSLFQIQQNWEQRCSQNFMASYSSSQQEQWILIPTPLLSSHLTFSYNTHLCKASALYYLALY